MSTNTQDTATATPNMATGTKDITTAATTSTTATSTTPQMSSNINTNTTNTTLFLTMEQMTDIPQYRSILEPASRKAGFTSYTQFLTWLLSPALLPMWLEFERDFLIPFINSRSPSNSTTTSPIRFSPTTPVPPGPLSRNPTAFLASFSRSLSDFSLPTATLLPFFEHLFLKSRSLPKGSFRENENKKGWDHARHHVWWFFLRVFARNRGEDGLVPVNFAGAWAGCYDERPMEKWVMQLCWVLDGMVRCKYGDGMRSLRQEQEQEQEQEQQGNGNVGGTGSGKGLELKEVTFPNGVVDKGCLIVYKT
ncbi:unnamed protein product [Sordaria macrospora k-hell]|uniref:WGS project CABT00000000 data, contig 2.10 n=1 Tax=Sordaria macrospora (strain ATCC MYA-333 / DSM 997 / K(L3346) / K-hell) TaxID=771870 RepID=F7VW97_SORMK|nr:uncharacterized protein SMAC_03475 [Sordaria macrospora k-hell]CCC09919.1 unnamed protein product [Sordaria macrospora k-hell]